MYKRKKSKVARDNMVIIDAYLRLIFVLNDLLSYPDSRLREIGPDGDLLARAHVRVTVPLECGLELLQLLAREVRPLPPLPLFLRRIIGGVFVFTLDFLFFYTSKKINTKRIKNNLKK